MVPLKYSRISFPFFVSYFLLDFHNIFMCMYDRMIGMIGMGYGVGLEGSLTSGIKAKLVVTGTIFLQQIPTRKLGVG